MAAGDFVNPFTTPEFLAANPPGNRPLVPPRMREGPMGWAALLKQPGQQQATQMAGSPLYQAAAQQAGVQYPLPNQGPPQGGGWGGRGPVAPQQQPLPTGARTLGDAVTRERTLFANPDEIQLRGEGSGKYSGSIGADDWTRKDINQLRAESGRAPRSQFADANLPPNTTASQLIAEADEAAAVANGRKPAGIANVMQRGTSSLGDEALAAASMSADDLATATAAGVSPSMWQRLKASGGGFKGLVGGMAAGLGMGLGLNTVGGMVGGVNPYAGDTIKGGGQGALLAGGFVPMLPGFGGTAAGTAGLGATGAALAGAGSAAAGAGIAQGFTGSEFGNDVVNNVRSGYSTDEEGGLANFVAMAGASPIFRGAANLFTGGSETDDDLLDIIPGASSSDTQAATPQEVVTGQNLVDRTFDRFATDPGTRQQLQTLYDFQLDMVKQDPEYAKLSDEEKAAQEKEVANITIQSAVEDWQMRQEQQQQLGQLESQRAMALQYMSPYTDSIRNQGVQQQNLLNSLMPQLPPALQGYAGYLASSAPLQANRIADGYLAQAAMAPSQIQQQQAAQQQQSFQNQIQQQLQAAEVQAMVEQIQNGGPAGVASTNIGGL